MVERFQYPFQDNYLEVDGVRLHYVDEGSGPTIVMVHGNTTWSYLYRKMIPPLLTAGYRCVAMDLMGSGLSDQPADESAYTLEKHIQLVTGLIDKLGLQGIITVGEDWGGVIILHYAIEHQDNVRALVILGTLLGPMKLPPIFNLLFRNGSFSSFLTRRLNLFLTMMFRFAGFKRPVDARVMEQYQMPHRTAATRATIAAFPKMIPTSDKHPTAEYLRKIDGALSRWDIPALVMFADKDIAFEVAEGQRIADMMPDGRFQVIRNAGHYLQEDAGEEIAERMITFLKDEANIAASG